MAEMPERKCYKMKNFMRPKWTYRITIVGKGTDEGRSYVKERKYRGDHIYISTLMDGLLSVDEITEVKYVHVDEVNGTGVAEATVGNGSGVMVVRVTRT